MDENQFKQFLQWKEKEEAKKKKKQIKSNDPDMITKKVASHEVLKRTMMLERTSIIGVAGIFVVELLKMFHTLAGVVGMLALGGWFVYALYKSRQDKAYLYNTYLGGLPTQQNNRRL